MSESVRVGALGVGAGGGAGVLTVTLAVRLSVPPGPVAVSVYVILLAGYTLRLPLASTSPRPGVMLILVVWPVTDHRNVESPPFSMVEGSASNVAMLGADGAAGATTAGAGAGGVVFTATFFL